MLLSTHKLFIVSFLTFWFGGFAAFGQNVVYVTPSGAGNQSGSSWGNALPGTQLQPRLGAATAGMQFWIAGGMYKPTTGTDRNASFSLRNNVEVYGGFAGTESTLAQRPTINSTTPSATTLSGDIRVAGDRNDNTYTVFRNTGLNASAVLDGVVIRDGAGAPWGGGMFNNGYGTGGQCNPNVRNCLFTQNSAEWGGAVYNFGINGGNSSPVFIDCVFSQNRAFSNHGGAMYNDATNGTSSPTLTNCQFTQNIAAGRGGAVANNAESGTANSVLTNCVFSQNTANQGGGMANYASGNVTANPTLTNCLFSFNNATDTGGGISSTAFTGATALLSLTGCRFDGNQSQGNGGGLFNFSSSANSTSAVARFTVSNCGFNGNSGTYGGAFFSGTIGKSVDGLLTGCTFTNNTALYGGGAMSVGANSAGRSDTRILNTQFSGNNALNGGAMFSSAALASNTQTALVNCLIKQNTATTGGAVYSDGQSGNWTTNLTNCTISRNRASSDQNNGESSSGALCGIATSNNSSGTTLLSSCIVTENTDNSANRLAIKNIGNITTSITYSNIQGGFTGTGNIDADPLFVDPANGNFRLQAGSPSINTGDPGSTTASVAATDLAGNPRIDSGRIDMGAYERQTVSGPILTLKEGNWNDPATWLNGQLPGAGDTILIRHRVGLPASYVGNARTVQYDTNGQLVFSPAARLLLN